MVKTGPPSCRHEELVSGRLCRYLAIAFSGEGAATNVMGLLVKDMNLLLKVVELSVSALGRALDTLIGAQSFTRLNVGRVLLTHSLLLPRSLRD